jgi:hypothetical protein
MLQRRYSTVSEEEEAGVEPKWCLPYFKRGILWLLSNMADKIVKF